MTQPHKPTPPAPAPGSEPVKGYVPAVVRLLAAAGAQRVLDAPCGNGWLARHTGGRLSLDGVDLYAGTPPGYRQVLVHDLNDGLPQACHGQDYDAVVSCEGIEHVSNPLLLLRQALACLKPGGLVVVTTPNTWYPAARLQYLLRGFFPSFPNLVGRIVPGTHMHVMPWNYASLYLHLRLAGFEAIRLEPVDEPAPRHAAEWLVGWPAVLYARSRLRKAASDEERQFWADAASRSSLMGRRLVVHARRPAR